MKVMGGAFGVFAVLAFVAALLLEGPQAPQQPAPKPVASAKTAAH